MVDATGSAQLPLWVLALSGTILASAESTALAIESPASKASLGNTSQTTVQYTFRY